MPSAKQLVGKRFGRLTVFARVPTHTGRALWSCVCDCGKKHEVVSNALTSGHTKSCGCWNEDRKKQAAVHGHSRRGTPLTPTYRTWQAMMTRCYNPNSKSWKNYGGRGIKVCDGWHYFENFLADMGARPANMTIERNDLDGDYVPNNCRWATRVEQNRNTRRNMWVQFKGARMTQAEFAESIGLKRATVSYRLRKGWTPEQVAETPAYLGNRISTSIKLGETAEIPEEL